MAEAKLSKKRLLRRMESLKLERTMHEPRMNDAIKYVLPYHHSMLGADKGKAYEDRRYDSTAAESASLLADGMVGSISPSTTKWFATKSNINERNDDPFVKELLQEIEERMVEAVARSNYYELAPTIFKHAIALETVGVVIDKDIETGSAVLVIIPPSELYVVNDAHGKLDAAFRRYKLTAEQAVNLWPDRPLSPAIMRDAEQNPDNEHEFLAVYMRRHQRERGASDVLNMPWAGYFCEVGGPDDVIIEETGYQTQPIAVWRWEIRGRDPYGYGLTTEAMPEIKVANGMARSLLKMADRASDPPVFLPESMADQFGRDDNHPLDPGAVNFYTDNYRPYEFHPSSGFPITDRVLEQQREKIRSIFKTKYFMMLMQLDQQGTTAYEIRERKIEKITAMSSIIGRCQKEFLDAFLARVFWLEMEAGRMPQNMDILGGGLDVEYIGPFAQAQKEVAQTGGVVSGLTNIAGMLQIWPDLAMKIRAEIAVDSVLEASGFPQKAIVPNEEYQQMKEAAAQAQQQMAMAEAIGKSVPAFTQRAVPGSVAEQVMGGGA